METAIFIGIPGSGKTTFYRQRFFASHIRISLDMLKTRHRETLLVLACLQARQAFVIDNTNVLRKEREKFIRLARAAGFQVSGYFFEPNINQAIGWNFQRIGKAAVPIKAIFGMAKRLERPVPDEGFDHLYRVQVDCAGGLDVRPWTPPN